MRVPMHILIFAFLALVGLASCGDEDSPTGLGSTQPEPPARVVLVGDHIIIASDTSTLRAFARYEDGRDIDVTDEVEWISSNEQELTVDGGVITKVNGGQAEVSVTYAGVTGSIRIVFARRYYATGIFIEGADHLPQIGDTTQLVARHSFPGDSQVDISANTVWESSDPSIVTVDESGIARAVGLGEVYVTAYYGSTVGSHTIVAGPIPDTSYRVIVEATWLRADYACEASDLGASEFSYELSLVTSEGARHLITTTSDYPSSSDFDIMEDEQGTTGVMALSGEVTVTLTEAQSFEVTARVTEWDHEFYYFGDYVPDGQCDDLRETAVHRGSNRFDPGTNEIHLRGSGGDCDLRTQYRIVAVEQ